ncbi:RT0821/Lpp0805 family surface protein [Geopsychrobacter electrodiphilus]|uniref:RT0821/Lpp0805 family surface protein n=1 Tax=Geopsychrobacter electrodiphilus TaxID=225196 RepID=UPI000373AF56|nr:RT0821/Lpp0805 family surface protein [Geopsychrobacter electrodiphilus]
MNRAFIWTLLVLLILTGCAPGVGPKEQGGVLLGAGTGALLGSHLGRGHGSMVAVAIGTLAGAMIGQELGHSLDQADRLAMNQNLQEGLEHNHSQETNSWNNPDNKHCGSLTPIKTFRTAKNDYCREYLQTVVIGGQESRAYGTACRTADGSWKIVK